MANRTSNGPIDLSGQVAVVTGGGSGVGLAITRLLGERGCRVWIGSRSQRRVEQAAQQLRDEGLMVQAMACDVTSRDDVMALRDAALSDTGRLDIWVNNAGRAGAFGPILATPEDDFLATTDTVIRGTYYGSLAALDAMTKAGGGDLITLIYLLALFRFFFALSGLDTGSPFAGVGASRELTLGILVEPMLILSLLVLALIADSTHIEMISNTLAMGWNSPLTTVLALLACGFACFIEMGKIPFDVAEAEQELQEGPLTEYSGAGLALAKWGLGLKQVVMAALFVALFLPFGRAQELSLACLLTSLVVTLLKVLLIFVLASIAENTLARGRFLLIHHVTWLGFSLAALAWVFWLTGL